MQTYGNTEAIGPFTASSENEAALKVLQGRGEKREYTFVDE